MIDSNVRIFSLYMKAYVDASYDPRFFYCFVKLWATCENIWANGSPAPRRKVARTPMNFSSIVGRCMDCCSISSKLSDYQERDIL